MPEIETRVMPAEIKMVQGDPSGTFEAIVSVFGNVDLGGDVVAKGAFTESLARGLPPIGWQHIDSIPPIGVATAARETNEGLFIKARLFIDDESDHQYARMVYAGLKSGAIREFSFGYTVPDGGSEWQERDGHQVRVLKQVDLIEASPVWKGMNPSTRLIGVKHAEHATDGGTNQSGGEVDGHHPPPVPIVRHALLLGATPNDPRST